MHFPGESSAYRAARDRLLDAERDLRNQIWPLWNVFDFTPDGRGTDWYPKLAYK